MTARTPNAVRRFTIVAVVIPIVLVVLAVVVQLIALPSLPDPIAVHWGFDGQPDGFAPAWASILLTAVVGLGVPLLIAVSGLSGLRRGDRGATYRLLGATASAMAALMAVLSTGTVLGQVGLGSAQDAPSIALPVLVALAAAIVAGVAGWMLQPHQPYRPTLVAGKDVHLAAGERAVWLQRVQLARGGAITLGLALVLLLAMTLVTGFAGAPAGVLAITIAVTLVLALLVATTVAFHVRVDETGLTVNSVVGIPRAHVPLSDIDRVEAVQVNPMGEFGGWGLRWAPGGGFGVVLRSGPGIRVRRTGGKVFTVTVDDAATGAALLEALRVRAPDR
ncbi:DUF1648 domain-containing protein [uncultured Microbacterium sp.]|uniref:DUF1648 domain-containing protein n=1 Tax=uncultured Microbacterium sp. TaxID=191216 RepID=UPI002595650A|nr:DUF1648 domain-containing protein [uncultured Microbacterium sp.]